MSANPDALYQKLKTLPPQRLAEIEDFMDFLARKEARTAALDRLLAVAPALEAAGVSRPSEEDIAVEVRAVRAEQRATAQRKDHR